MLSLTVDLMLLSSFYFKAVASRVNEIKAFLVISEI